MNFMIYKTYEALLYNFYRSIKWSLVKFNNLPKINIVKNYWRQNLTPRLQDSFVEIPFSCAKLERKDSNGCEREFTVRKNKSGLGSTSGLSCFWTHLK